MALASEVFLISKELSIKSAMQQMADIGHKTLFIVDEHKQLLGVLSDGDVRKWILAGGNLGAAAWGACNQHPKIVGENYRDDEVKEIMLTLVIEAVPVVNSQGEVVTILTWENLFAGTTKAPKGKVMIPVVIMAGGKGTRLDPFTKILPKPLIPIGDKPVIEIIMDRFYAHGVEAFHVSVNHKGRMIKSYFEEMNNRYAISYIDETKPLGTAGSLRLLKNIGTESLFMTNCDILVDGDYAEMVNFHEAEHNDITLVVSCRRHVIPYGICEIENGGTLRAIREKPVHDLLVNTGMYMIKTSMLQLIPEDTYCDVTDLIANAQRLGHKVGVFPISETSWTDVGQWEEYHNAVKKFRLA